MKKIFNKKKIVLIFSPLFLLSFIFFSLSPASKLTSIYFSEIRKIPIYSVETDEKHVAISFDAAWGADKTEKIMDICDDYGVKATFFLVGFWVEKYEDITKTIASRGFEIGMHSNTHPDMSKLTAKKVKEELEKNRQIIKAVANVDAKIFRPPFGYYNNTLITCCEEMGIQTVQWSVDSLDWKGISAGEIASRICKLSKNGSIILCHNNSDNILDGLKMVLEFFKKNNYKVGPVGDLIYKDNYTITRQGTQIKSRRN